MSAWASYVTLPTSWDGVENIKKHSIEVVTTNDIVQNTQDIGFSLLTTLKVIMQWVLLIYVVYIGVQMILSMWNDEEQLSQAKRQIRYALVGLVFINIPWDIYESFNSDTKWNIDGNIWYSSWLKSPGSSDSNLFIDTFDFWYTLNGNIIGFLEVAAFGLAVLVITLAGIKMLTSRGQDDQITEAKNKIIWSTIGLVSIGFIEAWKSLVYKGKVSDGTTFFETIANLALFFAGPIAIIFLTLWAYYYITANGDEDKTKKAKSIVVNTLIATVILLASYTFLLDLANL